MAKKVYYKIGETCKMFGIQPYVLRYWETEFPFLGPTKNKSGQRVYEESQIVLIKRIKELLYDEEYTIAGAKKKLEVELFGGAEDEENASLSSESSSGSESVALKLDSAASEKIEKLRRGVEEALAQSRDILRWLDSKSA